MLACTSDLILLLCLTAPSEIELYRNEKGCFHQKENGVRSDGIFQSPLLLSLLLAYCLLAL